MYSRFKRSCISSSPRPATIAISLAMLLLASSVSAEPANRKIGFSVQVSTSGLTKTTVAKISIIHVHPNSQALTAGVKVGDELVTIDNTSVPGNSVFKLKEHMAFVPGVPKKITFKRPTGALYEVIFVRAGKSESGR